MKQLWMCLAVSMTLSACDVPVSDTRAPTADATPPVSTASDFAMRAEPVAEGVYAIITPARDFPNPENKGWNSNSSFVITHEGVLVVDTGSSAAVGASLAGTIRGVTAQPIRWIVNTHGHGDHWLGSAALAGPKTEVIAGSKVRNRIRDELAYWVDLFDKMTNGATGKDVKAVLPTTVIDSRSTRNFGGVAATFIPSGDSHSPGDLLVWLPEKKVLISGDVVYTDRAPVTFDGRVAQWIKFLRELEGLGVQKLIPGHGRVGDAADITRQREYFEMVWNAVEKGFEAGQADFEILPTIKAQAAKYRDSYPDLDKQIGRTVSHVYLQVEEIAF